ncbi:MAG: 3-deoxy-8-phosphooctulonate synthase [Bacteroidetes bacterium]|nr:3-deoxy-8-phosphooctulonate synthase [Bacteroidota bacterium]MBU1422205.1 3-deoxy-8-phosphooctulonate synthase [Bacteroidota bacterium]MBU2447595.1 3-deoxy-8-phosphooctulonate synthase [Bacteroidota bacterium]MBU2471473.1 3-deoxy-8-phosphooctulonate synthase [Bacteroidota bacterium]MBU2636150.1 3-deoxy-8-phosphooctulonate synthase [Bacteroidota bacterium]
MIKLQNIKIGSGNPLVLIAGPCVVESRELTLRTADRISKITKKHNVPFIFKSSYKKANRTSSFSFSTIGMHESLRILSEIKSEFDVPILTDIHTESEAAVAAEVADILQIPAFLCRQTELLQAAGRTGKIINIKKGQFLAPEDMKHQADKVISTGNKKVMLTERGTTFGYHNLVVDMRSLQIMHELGHPVILDATHSVQLPGAGKGETSGSPEFIFPISRAGVAVGIDGLFLEVHPDPKRALSDAASQLKLDLLEELIKQVAEIDKLVKTKLKM